MITKLRIQINLEGNTSLLLREDELFLKRKDITPKSNPSLHEEAEQVHHWMMSANIDAIQGVCKMYVEPSEENDTHEAWSVVIFNLATPMQIAFDINNNKAAGLVMKIIRRWYLRRWDELIEMLKELSPEFAKEAAMSATRDVETALDFSVVPDNQ